MRIKVSEATPRQLNFLVAKCVWGGVYPADFDLLQIGRVHLPCTDWVVGGPIIDKMFEKVFEMHRGGPGSGNQRCWAKFKQSDTYHHGPTTLTAAMRCFVASELGDDVEIPEELK